MVLEIEEKWINPQEIIFDPENPRKVDLKDPDQMKDIVNMAKTYETQGIINEPEIDEHNMCITGELRIRSAQYLKLPKIKVKILKNLTELNRRERQLVENLHLHKLKGIEKENAVANLWEKGHPKKYKTHQDFADILGFKSATSIGMILDAVKIREKFGLSNIALSTGNVYSISRLDDTDQEKVVNQILAGKAPTNLAEYVSKIKGLPRDVKQEVLKIEKPLDIKDAMIVAQYPEKDQREEVIKTIRFSQDSLDHLLQYQLDVAKGKIPKQVKLYDVDREKFGLFQRISLRLMSRMNISFLEDLSQDVKYMCYNLMKQIVEHLNRELEKIEDSGYRYNNLIEVKMEDVNEE